MTRPGLGSHMGWNSSAHTKRPSRFDYFQPDRRRGSVESADSHRVPFFRELTRLSCSAISRQEAAGSASNIRGVNEVVVRTRPSILIHVATTSTLAPTEH